MNKQVGTLYGSRTVTFEMIIRTILDRFIPKDDIPKFELEKFSKILNDIEAEFLSPTITTMEITPLFGFRSDEPRIPLANGLSIEILSDKEISKLLSSGVPMSLQMFYTNMQLFEFQN
ncbi:hypothetical protein MKU65_07925 [Leptospira interrogans]|nr:hypothetical protein [Leptospira interrogans]MCH1886193.1 hypothetical protein [Leptospira interrogans]MCH1902638.1 hypothetical protein [Leptospira interrogans]UPO16666.2 hypothetical protein MY479_09645 [Leptospira interrogans]UQX08482.1 hypothetical protein MY415_08000 [Leptospira interrogans]WOT12000.1 hypothetical protein CFY92_0005845 [Leptospira interrogans]